MYSHITGTLIEKSPVHAVIEAGGIGYFARISAGTYRALPSAGASCKLHLFLSVREDAMDLYGFAGIDEKRTFTELVKINGVGPQSALAVLSALNVQEFLRAVEAGDIAAISRARGIGRKLAQRIILELRGALAAEESEGELPPAATQAEEALVTLGYSRKEALERVRKAMNRHTDFTVEDLVRSALQVGLKK